MRNKGYKDLPIIKFESADELLAFSLERVLTQHFGIAPEGGILLNERHGGEGGWSLSDNTKKILSKINSGEGNPNFGKKWSEDRHNKQRIAWASKDRSKTPESMAKTWAAKNRQYEIITNTGEVLMTSDLTKFCKDRSLPLSSFRKTLVAGGGIVSRTRPSAVDGWSIKYI
jgi:hypothetical protein